MDFVGDACGRMDQCSLGQGRVARDSVASHEPHVDVLTVRVRMKCSPAEICFPKTRSFRRSAAHAKH